MEANLEVASVAVVINGRIWRGTSSVQSNIGISKVLCLCGTISGKVKGASGVKTNDIDPLLPVDFVKD